MNYEKKYKEVLERAREELASCGNGRTKMLERIFPELKKSEDEKIKNRLINLIKMSSEFGGLALHKWEADEMLAWLEKQVDYANFRDKAQVGDRITKNEDGVLVNLSQLKRVAKPSGKQGEHAIYNVPAREVILAIWDLGNEWKELTNGCISTEYGTQLDYIQKHWYESEYYLREKQGEKKSFDYENVNIPQRELAPKSAMEAIEEEKVDNANKVKPKGYDSIDPQFFKPADSYCQENCKGFQETGKCFADGECKAKREAEQKHVIKFKTAEESLGIDSDTYNKIVDECIFGEQKPADKVEPKFKVGDWCIDNEGGVIFQIVKVLDNTYTYKTNEGKKYSCSHYSLENDVHLWTIQDAKDGDVLYINNTLSESIMIYKSFNNGVINKYASYNKFGFECENYLTLNDGYIIPATKEQHDFLFEKMNEAGYEWDAEKKELKKIEQKSQRMISAEAKEAMYDKPAWSEEDETMLNEAIYLIRREPYRENDAEPIVDWLQSLKDRVQPQPKQEWSEEDDEFLRRAINAVKGAYPMTADWLKSLRPQNAWKPSDEHIGLLQAIINEPNNAASESCQIVLKDILEQLKKLKEEV